MIIRRGLTIIVGHSGLGKTFLALQLMRAVAEGRPFLDSYWTPDGGERVGMLQLEMPGASIRDRIRAIGGQWLNRTSFLCMPDFPVDITQRETQDELIHWCKAERLALLVADPLNRMHDLDENKTGDMARIMSGWHRVRAKASVSVVLLHHVTKTIQDLKTAEATPRTMVLQMVRGSGRLGNDPDTIAGILEAPGGRVRLVWAKTRHCETPSETYLTRNGDGFFSPAEAIQQVRANTTEGRILHYVTGRGNAPPTAAEIAVHLRMSRSGIQKRINRMIADMSLVATGYQPTRYEIPSEAISEIAEQAPLASLIESDSVATTWDTGGYSHEIE
jgi:hypothetical protein